MQSPSQSKELRRAQKALAGSGVVGAIHRPATIEELAEVAREPGPFRISGLDSRAADRRSVSEIRIELSNLAVIVDYEPRDQVIVALAGTPLAEIANVIRPDGFWIPGNEIGSLGGAISVGDRGIVGWSWRDCVLGMRIVLADGRIVKFGSRAVKNVAGYDGHKLFIGALGTLGVIAEVFLRLNPGEPPSAQSSVTAAPAVESITDPTVIRYMRRTKDLFDPTHKLNPGEMGIF